MIKQLIKRLMSNNIERKRFVPSPEQAMQGAVPMSKEEILESLMRYKAQNPEKYTQKKAALFAKYGLDLEDEPVELQDPEEQELETIKKRVTKKK